jgi:type II secretory pathway pseudopilin PulG
MTLLESLAALVILGTTAVGFLEVFHTTARVTRDASEWARVTAYAESVMEGTKTDGGAGDAGIGAPRGVSARVETRAWAPGVSEVIVVVTSTAGQRLELRRLTRDAPVRLPGSTGMPR